MEWARILGYITGTVDQELLLRNEYLAAENRILRGQIKGRLRLSDEERATLGEIGHRSGRKALAEVAKAAVPDTIVGILIALHPVEIPVRLGLSGGFAWWARCGRSLPAGDRAIASVCPNRLDEHPPVVTEAHRCPIDAGWVWPRKSLQVGAHPVHYFGRM